MKFLEKKIPVKVKIALPLLVLLFFTIVFLGQGLATPVFKGYSAGNISPDNGTQYNPANLYNFTVNITDSINGTGFIKNVTFELNLSNGSYVNYTNNASNNLSTGPKPGPFNISKVWWMNFTQSQIGPPGSYNFTWSAYNNSGSYNHSSTVVYNISKNQTNPVNLTIQNTTDSYTNQNVTVSYPSWTNVTGYPIYQSSGSVFLFRDGTNRSTSSENVTLRAGTHEYKVNITGNENYTANDTGSTYYIFVNKGDPSSYTNLYLDNQTSTLPITYPDVAEVRGNVSAISGAGDLDFKLYRNNTYLGVGNTTNQTVDSTRLANGTYQLRYNTTGGVNWTIGSNSRTLKVLKGPQKLTLALNGSLNDTYVYEKGEKANLTVWSNITQNNITANMTLIANFTQPNKIIPVTFSGLNMIQNLTDTGNLDPGDYKISANVSSTQNYTKAYNNSLILTVNDSTDPTVLLYNYSNATFKKSGDSLGLNISLSDNDEFEAFNVSIWVNNSTSYVLVGKIGNSTKVGSKQEWANGTVTLPSGLVDGNSTLKINISDSSGNEGLNNSYVVQIDNTKPSVNVSVSDDSITAGFGVTINCERNASISGVNTTSLTVEDPYGNKASASCGGEFTHTSSTGTYTVTYTVEDRAGNSNSASTTFHVSSTGDGGGAAGGLILPSQSHSWLEIAPGVVQKMKINDPEGMGVKQISISVKNKANNVKITVTKQEGKPADVDVNVSGKAYRYMKINAENLNENNTKEAKVQFSVNKSWISGNNIDPAKVYLNRYKDGNWNNLGTTKISETPDNITYEAETPGFSYFAVSGEEKTVEKPGKEEEVCVQVITPAVNPNTWKCKDYPTPCDVPDGWKKVDSCGPVNKAVDAIESAENVSSSEAKELLQQARTSLEAGDYNKAKNLAEDALKKEVPKKPGIPWLALLIIIVLIIGAIYYFYKKNKTRKKPKK